MKFTKDKACPEVIYIEPKLFGDDRGYFFEAFHQKRFQENGINEVFVQDNQSRSSKGVLRGLHYQKNPKEQAKCVRVLEGEVFDVAVDIRKDSPQFGKWTGYRLDSESKNMLYIPKGFAHGFYVLSEFATVIYKCAGYYAPDHEVSIRYDDPDINIKWPLSANPILSEKDLDAGYLSEL